MTNLFRIEGPDFVAGLQISGLGIVWDYAPIIAYMKLWSRAQVQSYCLKRGWQLTEVK